MLKASLRKAERSFSERIGCAIQRAASLRGWSLKELAAALDRNERQVARWINGGEHPQLDTLFAVEELQQPLLMALAELLESDCEMETVIRLKCKRRSA